MLDPIEVLQAIWFVWGLYGVAILQAVWFGLGLVGLLLFGRQWWRMAADVRYLRRAGGNGFRKIFVLGNRRRAFAFVLLQLNFLAIGLVPTLPRSWRALLFTALLLSAVGILNLMAIGEDRHYTALEVAITEKEHGAAPPPIMPGGDT